MPEWVATIVASVIGALVAYALGFRQGKRAEKRAERAERRERQGEKRDRARFERERQKVADEEATEEDYREFLAAVYEDFEFGGRSFSVEPDDLDLGTRAVNEGRFDEVWKSGKLSLRRRRQ
jgi:hypothetical protein